MWSEPLPSVPDVPVLWVWGQPFHSGLCLSDVSSRSMLLLSGASFEGQRHSVTLLGTPSQHLLWQTLWEASQKEMWQPSLQTFQSEKEWWAWDKLPAKWPVQNQNYPLHSEGQEATDLSLYHRWFPKAFLRIYPLTEQALGIQLHI